MKVTKLIFTLSLFTGITITWIQTGSAQVIKGIVTDKESQIPLPGASVSIEGTDPMMGTVTTQDGNFHFDHVPVGRHTIRISFMGYEPYLMREVLVGSGKEVIVNAELKELPMEMKEVIIKANNSKEKPLNTMAMLSARSLSVEEANRYAGGFDDPARLASVFAGVAGNLQNNGIVIRGNAPKGMLWRMEGVEIANPSHFANLTTFGSGGITALSSQMLANSDFFTGAFPAEYGNALSGVFDLKLKNGNNEKTEFTLQAGIVGLDFSAEGPFKKGKKASFIFNYRYSTYSLLGPLLPEDAGGIRYQDLCFKLNFPTLHAGTFSVWGIGALDKSPQKAERDSMLWTFNQDKEEASNHLDMGAIGINHKFLIGSKSVISSALSLSGNTLDHKQGRLDDQINLQPMEVVNYDNWKYSFSTNINHKFSARHTNRTGIIIDNLNYNYTVEQAEVAGQPLSQLIKEKTNRNLWQAYSQSRYEITPELSACFGLHSQYFSQNRKHTLEPRAGLTWKFTPSQSVSVGYGHHSQLEMLQIYMIRKQWGNNFTEPNKNLDFSKAHHIVFAYHWNINENLHFSVEPYYQFLYNIPVVANSSFSLINLDKNWFITDSLVNKGKGTNQGVDLTFERFLKKGYYYLITASIFNSKYKGGDGIEHDTRYNKHYVFNVLGGKEWVIKNKNMLSLNGKITFAGGDHISPLDMQASLLKKEAVYDETRAFSDHKPSVVYMDFTINYKINHAHHSSTWSLKMINALGAKEYYEYRYNYKKNMMEMESEATIIPDISYKIEF
jgi:hypothetical protein